MRCLMDIRDDELRRETDRFYQPRDPSTFRHMRCKCDVDPVEPQRLPGASGCVCPICGAHCKKCSGFWVQRSEPCFHRTLRRALDLIDRGNRFKKRPPDYVRMGEDEIDVLREKVLGEDSNHMVHQIIDPGPPLRVYGVVVIADKRRL